MNNAADIIPGVGMKLKGYAVWLSIKMYTFAVYSLKCQCVPDLGVDVDKHVGWTQLELLLKFMP